MKTILVPIDFSECSDNAMRYAIEIAKHTESATITALYVMYPAESVDNNVYATFLGSNYLEERVAQMNTWVQRFDQQNSRQKVVINLLCQPGFPVSAICEAATDLHASLIVMGTTGTEGLELMLLGSTTGGVMSSSQQPLLIVPHKAVFRHFSHFAFATDFKIDISHAAIKVMQELMHMQHSQLNVVSVTDTETNAADRLTQEKKFSKKMGDIPHQFHYLHGSSAVKGVLTFLASTDSDGLIVVAHEHSLLHNLFVKSTSQSLAHHLSVPMLVLHDAEKK